MTANSGYRSIAVREIVEQHELEFQLLAGSAGLDRLINYPRIQKSGLILVGHMHGVIPERIQVLGETELSYFESLSPEGRRRAAESLCSAKLSAVLITRGITVDPLLLEAAERSATPLLVTTARSSVAIMRLHCFLDQRLAPRTCLHGVMVDVFEVGVLLVGESGIGKSESALELVMRGHRLVADDIVECDFQPPGVVYGESAELLRHHLEVRGLGILNIFELYGVTAVRDRKRLDLIIRLEPQEMIAIDRLGNEGTVVDILEVPIRELVLPVRPGRNNSSLIEIAARNELLRLSGYDASTEFLRRVDQQILDGKRVQKSHARAPRTLSPRDESVMPPAVIDEQSVERDES